jgi:hypothetical protein
MNKISRSICITLLAFITFGVAAAPEWAFDASRLPPGISPARAEQLITRFDELARHQRQQEARVDRERHARIQRLADPIRERAEQALRSDPDLRRTYQEYSKALAAAFAPELSARERDARLAALDRYEPAVAELMRRAGYDEQRFQRDVEGALGMRGRSANARVRTRSSGDSLLFSRYTFSLRSPSTSPPPPSPYDELLAKPYPYTQLAGGSYGSRYANKDDGRYRATALLSIAGGEEQRAGLAHFKVMPNGYSKVRISAALPETSWRVVAGGVLVLTGATARSRIEVMVGNQLACNRVHTHQSVWVVALWYTNQTGSDSVVLECNVNATPGQEIVVRYTGEGTTWGGGGGGAVGEVVAAPRDIRLTFSN